MNYRINWMGLLATPCLLNAGRPSIKLQIPHIMGNSITIEDSFNFEFTSVVNYTTLSWDV